MEWLFVLLVGYLLFKPKKKPNPLKNLNLMPDHVVFDIWSEAFKKAEYSAEYDPEFSKEQLKIVYACTNELRKRGLVE